MKLLNNINTPYFSLPVSEEAKIRALANELAKDILEPNEILAALDISQEEYDVIKDTRAFRELHSAAVSEWKSAANTQKRTKLLSAATVEAALPTFWKDFNNPHESLNARVGLLNALAKIGGLGLADPVERVAMPGQLFKLEIHLADKKEVITIEGQAQSTIDSSSQRDEDQSDYPDDDSMGDHQDQHEREEEFDPFA